MILRNSLKALVVIISLVIFCSFTANTFLNDRLNIPALGFSMMNPDGWLNQPKQSFHENLSKFDLKKDELETLIKDFQNSLPISTVTKYHPMEADGVLPTINVIGRTNPIKDQSVFLQSMGISIPMLKKVTYDFVLETKPEFRTVSGVKAGYFCAHYNLKMTDGSMAACRNQTYAIPNGDFVIQISMIDKPGDLCDETFAKFLTDLDISIL